MTRTVLRHSISVLAALALISVFAASPVSAQQVFLDEIVVTAKKREKAEPEGSPIIFDHSGLITQGAMNPSTPKGLATNKGSPVPRRQFMLTNELQNLNGRR